MKSPPPAIQSRKGTFNGRKFKLSDHWRKEPSKNDFLASYMNVQDCLGMKLSEDMSGFLEITFGAVQVVLFGEDAWLVAGCCFLIKKQPFCVFSVLQAAQSALILAQAMYGVCWLLFPHTGYQERYIPR